MNSKRSIIYCLMAIVSLLLAACASDWRNGIPTEQPETPAGQNAITFSAIAQSSKGQTRADQSVVNRGETYLPATDSRKDSEGDSYYVGMFGYYTGSSAWSDEAVPDLFYNQQMSIGEYTESLFGDEKKGNPLSYSPLRFWSNNEGDKMSFWAYYPYNATGDPGEYGIAITTDSIDKGMGRIRFRMHSDAAQHNDFLVSELVKDQTKPALVDNGEGGLEPKPVQLKFHHALAQVRLYAFVRGTDKIVYATDEDGNRITATTENGYVGEPYLDVYGTVQTLQEGDPIPDDAECLNPKPANPQTERWDRKGGVLDMSGTCRRANITYTMEFRNINTSNVFRPTTTDGITMLTASPETASERGNVKVSHYIMNPYWFTFNSSNQREQLNTTYMYGAFEETTAYEPTAANDGKDGNRKGLWTKDGVYYNDRLFYLLGEEDGGGDRPTLDQAAELEYPDDPEKHYNYAPGNIILAVPQELTDAQVPHVVITATGELTTGEEKTATVTINLLGLHLRWESGFIYSYAFIEDNLYPGADIVRGPESITVVFDPTKWTDQW
ncbi:MAG: fimbrillin family protein [Prevotella sp.]|nr:fimbrillin family protein [Prevotella sp.]